MELTIQWLLEQNTELTGFSCLAGEQGIHRIIKSINIMDNPDTVPWLKKDELILSTGYIISSTDIYKNIIQNLHDQGCCGLGIKMNRYMDTLPVEMIEQANRLGFIIFSIPFSSTMEQIVSIVYRQMFSNEMSQSERLMTFYKNIAEAALKRQSVFPVLENISKAVSNPVFLTLPDFELIECSIPKKSKITLPLSCSRDSDSIFSEVDSIFLQNEYQNNPLPVRHHTVQCQSSKQQFLLFSIVSQQTLLGYLICLEEVPFTSFEYELLSSIQSILGLTMLKTNSITNDGQQIDRSRFFNELLSGKLKTEHEIEPLCTQYGFNFSSDRICAVLRFDSYSEMSVARQRAFTRKVISYLLPLFSDSSIELTYTSHEDNLVLFLFLDKIDTYRKTAVIDSFIRKMIHRLNEEKISFLLGISSVSRGASTIFRNYTEALRALELGKRLHPHEQSFNYEKDRIYHLLSANYTAAQLMELYTLLLKPLDEYDSENNSSLSQTLLTYLECGQNIAQTAKQLYIHRNTMIYRMEQIQSIIDFNPKDFHNVYLIQTAFYIKKLLSL